MNTKLALLTMLDEIGEDCKQAAREIFYAMSFIELNNPARANLQQALKHLGVHEPKDVGLSNSVLRKRT
jgi:hypothetical protein